MILRLSQEIETRWAIGVSEDSRPKEQLALGTVNLQGIEYRVARPGQLSVLILLERLAMCQMSCENQHRGCKRQGVYEAIEEP